MYNFDDEYFEYITECEDVTLSSGKTVSISFISQGYETVTYYSKADYYNDFDMETKTICKVWDFSVYDKESDDTIDNCKELVTKYGFTEQEVEEMEFLAYYYSDCFKDVDEWNYNFKPKIKPISFYQNYYKNIKLKPKLI